MGIDPAAVDPVVLGSQRAQDTDRPDVETASERYAARFSGPAGEWLLARQSDAVQALLDRIGTLPLRVLDVGGGHGQVAPLLLAAGHSVVVHGSARECFERVAPLREEYPERLAGTASSLWSLPFADASFDLVVAVRLLGHVVRWRELVAEMARVARRYVLLEFARAATLVPQSLGDVVFSVKHHIEGTTRPFFCYRQSSLETELRTHGFSSAAGVAQFALPMVLHRLAGGPELLRRAEDGLRRIGVGDAMRSPVLLLGERNGAFGERGDEFSAGLPPAH